MTVSTLSPVRLDSPAFFREDTDHAVEIVLVGRVCNTAGDAVTDAVLEVRSVHLHTEEAGIFELLLAAAVADSEDLVITVSAAGYQSLQFHVSLAGSVRQTDGTRVAMHDVTLQAEAA